MATGKCVAALVETDMRKQMLNDMSAWNAFDNWKKSSVQPVEDPQI
jgi:hypothetical protein